MPASTRHATGQGKAVSLQRATTLARKARLSSKPKHASSITHQKVKDANFKDRLDGLPPELRALVYAFTVIIPIEELQHKGTVISRSYKPPLALTIDAKSRAAHAKDYYNTTTFSLDNTRESVITFIKYLDCLTDEHRSEMKIVSYVQPDDESFFGQLALDPSLGPDDLRNEGEGYAEKSETLFSCLVLNYFDGVLHTRFHKVSLDGAGEHTIQKAWTDEWQFEGLTYTKEEELPKNDGGESDQGK